MTTNGKVGDLLWEAKHETHTDSIVIQPIDDPPRFKLIFRSGWGEKRLVMDELRMSDLRALKLAIEKVIESDRLGEDGQ